MQFDECTPYETKGHITTEGEARASMELSLRWAARCRAEFERLANPNALFGIVQGGMYEHLREASIDALVGWTARLRGGRRQRRRAEGRDAAHRRAHAAPPAGDKPRYLMGVGTPEDLVEGVAAASTCSTA